MTRLRRKNSSFAAAAAALLTLAGCGLLRSAPDPAPQPPPDHVTPSVVVEAPAEPEPPRIEPAPVPAEPVLADTVRTAAGAASPVGWAERALAGLSLRRKVAQMIMPWALGDFTPAGSVSDTRLRELVEEEGVGGLIVSVGSPTEVAVKLNALQARAQVPILVASDLESGAGFRLRGAVHVPTNIDLGGATEFPSLMAVGAAGDPRLAYEMGRVTAEEARAVGIHVPFAPVLDVNNNPDNPIINVRSFGEDPEQVARLGAAFVRGMEENGALATGKHFPGHGDTGVDSHQALPLISAPRARLDSVELVPFRYAIAAGMRGIMTAHISVPALEGGGTDPATLSPRVMTGVLRDELGFDGLLFTDAMDMGAIDRGFGRDEAPVRAVLAGADVILMPPSVPQAIDAIVRAVESGRITEERIDHSVLRILRAKESLGLAVDRQVDPANVHRAVGIPEHVAAAREIAEKSLVLLQNKRDLLPLAGTRGARVMSVTFRRSAADLFAGRWFNEQLRGTYAGLLVESTDRTTPRAVWQLLEREARRSQLVVVSVYVTAWDAGAIPDDLADFIEGLAERRIPHVVVSFGNPYLLRRFPDVQSYLLAWSGAEVSQRSAARALVGQIPITGRMPTRIPPDFDIGAGIVLPARVAP
jgi:beta-N-acetylhexosaminidase